MQVLVIVYKVTQQQQWGSLEATNIAVGTKVLPCGLLPGLLSALTIPKIDVDHLYVEYIWYGQVRAILITPLSVF